MHPVWHKLDPTARYILGAWHESGHAVVAYRLGVPFLEIAIGEDVKADEAIGHILLTGVPPPVPSAYWRNRIVVNYSGRAAASRALKVFGLNTPELADIHTIGTKRDLRRIELIARDCFKIKTEEMPTFLRPLETKADTLLAEERMILAAWEVAAALREKGRMDYLEIETICREREIAVEA